MNSLPFISHHLFVAAIGNGGRPQERSTRQERPSAAPAGPTSSLVLAMMDSRKPLSVSAARLLRATAAQAQG